MSEVCTLPAGQLAFALSINPETNEISLSPIDELEWFISLKSDFHDFGSGELVRVSDETWAHYANKVGEVIKEGKKALITEVITTLSEDLTPSFVE